MADKIDLTLASIGGALVETAHSQRFITGVLRPEHVGPLAVLALAVVANRFVDIYERKA